jgi:D-alanyl-D-alanine carboxypeptidase (penicillin-binding protein 5/6)
MLNVPFWASIVFFFVAAMSISLPVPSRAAELKVQAQAALLMDANTGKLLWQRRRDLPLAPASTTKILSALILLEQSKPAELVTVPMDATKAGGGSARLRAGERLPVEQLLYAMMLVSANDAAIALAQHAAGSVPRFVAQMNESARKLGALRSSFRSPTGLPEKGHVTTAFDLGIITREALQHPLFRAVTAARTYSWRSAVWSGELKNSNALLERYPGAMGVKTGQTREAGFCLVAAAERRDKRLIAVLLKSSERAVWRDATMLLDFGFNSMSSEQ